MQAQPPSLLVQTSFQPPKSPTLAPTLRERLFAEPEKKSPDEIKQRLDAASQKRRLLLQATVEHASTHNKRARDVATSTKDRHAAAAAHKMAELSARLDAAAERRKNSPRFSPTSSPMASPLRSRPDAAGGAAAPKTVFSVPLDDSFSLDGPPKQGEEAAAEPLALHEEIAEQLAACGGEFSKLAQWIKEPATIGLVAEWLSTLGIERTLAKRLLALVYMAHDAQDMFDDTHEDQVMAREAARFKEKLSRQLKRGAAQSTKEPFEASFTRARRFYNAWSAQDVPKQAKVVDEALQRLHDAMMRVRAQHAHDGTEPEPPEHILAQIRVLAGEEAEAAARRQFLQAWEPVTQETLEARVREAATRAMWDALKAQVSAGDYTGLFGMLGELQGAMGALVSHSARAKEELADRFDAKWIEQQAGAGCLSTEQVHGLMRFLVERIGGWQAPADDEDTRAWAAGVERTLGSTGRMELAEFIGTHLVDFLAGAMERVGKVYQRVLELGGQMESLRATAARMDEEEAREGSASAQD